MLSVFLNRKKLLAIKEQILDDAAKPPYDELETNDRKRNRKVCVFLFVYVLTSVSADLIVPLFFKGEFVMPFYVKLPLVKLERVKFIYFKLHFNQIFLSLKSHPGFEINYVAFSYLSWIAALTIEGKLFHINEFCTF